METLEARVNRLTAKVQELELRLAAAPAPESGDVLCRRVEWTVSNIQQKLREMPKGQSLYSSEFAAGGVRGLQLEFFPNGRESATIDGMCSFFLWAGEHTRIRYQLFVGQHYRAPDDDHFHQKMGHGHSNFCRLASEIDPVSDSVTVGVEILDVSKSHAIGPGLKVIRAPLSQVLAREIQVIENKTVTRIEWKIKDVGKRLGWAVKGAAMYSPLFTAAGVKDMQIEFYLKGNQSTQKEGCCAYYLRCPEGTKLVVTMAVGAFKRGPIAANFEGPAGKGLPDFCEIADQIDRANDMLTVSVDVKNTSDELVDGKRISLSV